MKLIYNTGSNRIVDLVQALLFDGHRLDAVTHALSVFACEPLLDRLNRTEQCRVVLPDNASSLPFLGSPADRSARNRLQSRWLAACVRDWLAAKADIRLASGDIPQGAVIVRDSSYSPTQAFLGSLALTTDGLGL